MRKRIAASVVLILCVLALTYPAWKPLAKRSKWLVVTNNIFQDLIRRGRLVRSQIDQPPAPDASTAPRILAQINQTFDDYLHYSGLTPDWLRGRHVLEIGPGANVGVALRFASAGASEVVCLDKFVPLKRSSFERNLYTALRAQLTPQEQLEFDASVTLDSDIEIHAPRLRYLYGVGFENAADVLKASAFDLVVSRAVLEEIYDIDQAFAVMDRLLVPGGFLVHKIDLSDYGMFSKYGFHPLEFLTVADPIYRLMTEASGQPNRRLIDYYRGKLVQLGYRSTLFVTSVVGVPAELSPHKTSVRYGVDYSDETLTLIRTIRPRLLARFRTLPDDDLLISGLFIVARKPGADSR